MRYWDAADCQTGKLRVIGQPVSRRQCRRHPKDHSQCIVWIILQYESCGLVTMGADGRAGRFISEGTFGRESVDGDSKLQSWRDWATVKGIRRPSVPITV